MESVPIFFLSHHLEALIDPLLAQLEKGREERGIRPQKILVPHRTMKEWLQIELVKRGGIAMGLSISTPEQFFASLSFYPQGKELFFLLLGELQKVREEPLLSYLQGGAKRKEGLAEELSHLFTSYGFYGQKLFAALQEKGGWQEGLLRRLFVEGPWRLPVQTFPSIQKKNEPLHCFGIDFLPPLCWELLFRFSPLSVYLFSPCTSYWGDIATRSEKRKLLQEAPTPLRQELGAYLQECPPPLAHLGKLGRETLKILDPLTWVAEEVYPPLEESSCLKRLQGDLLAFRRSDWKGENDGSIAVVRCGSSRLGEVEHLRDRLLSLAEQGVPFSEMSILAPDPTPYAPLFEFLFSDPKAPIPYRISAVQGRHAPFYRGFLRLLHFALGRWSLEEFSLLLESPPFLRKRGWSERQAETFQRWLSKARVEWGWTAEHRKEYLKERLLVEGQITEDGCWNRGWEKILESFISLSPQGDPIGVGSGEELQEILSLFEEIKKDFLPLKKREERLDVWAEEIERWLDAYLLPDPLDEEDRRAERDLFDFAKELKEMALRVGEDRYPFSSILRWLERPSMQPVHPAILHGVRIFRLEEGAQISARALFLIGMGEGEFPSNAPPSSLDLLKKGEGFIPRSTDRERYAFLQALLSAQEELHILYRHLSSEEGKEVPPSLVVQELLTYLGSPKMELKKTYASTRRGGEKKRWPSAPQRERGKRGGVVLLSDLKALLRHPWKFYLERVEGIEIREEWRDHFPFESSRLLRSSLVEPIEEKIRERAPLGMLGEAFTLDVLERKKEWEERLFEWGIERATPFSFGEKGEPPLELDLGGEKVFLQGTVTQGSSKGYLHTGDDSVGGLLKSWPEILLVAIATGSSQIFCLKKGKVRTIESPQEALKKLIDYYFTALESPSPLIPDWCEALLRKGEMGGKGREEDPVSAWVFERIALASPEELYEGWAPYLREVFSELIALYPMRGRLDAKV